MKINEKEYKRKAQQIVERVVKPQVKNYENKKRNAEREYLAALSTMILVATIAIILVINLIFNL
jgi:hypothetical protein